MNIMECTYSEFVKLNIDTASISLESTESMYRYFCYPLNAKAIGLEGCILYCFIEGYDDMVFACNPESCVDTNTYPLAHSFCDFLRLVIACGSANPVEQIVWMSKVQFENHIKAEQQRITDAQQSAIKIITEKFNLLPMENPYEYVKTVQNSFDGSKIIYSDEYYEIKGIER